MLLRPASATWFELLKRDQIAHALGVLAATGQVELQPHSDVSAVHLLPRLRAAIDAYRHLTERYTMYWPEAIRSAVEHAAAVRPPASGAFAFASTPDYIGAWAAPNASWKTCKRP